MKFRHNPVERTLDCTRYMSIVVALDVQKWKATWLHLTWQMYVLKF